MPAQKKSELFLDFFSKLFYVVHTFTMSIFFQIRKEKKNIDGWLGGFEEMLRSVDKVGGYKKGQKHADVILEWSLISQCCQA